MGGFEDFKDLLNHLQWEFDTLAHELNHVKSESHALFQETAEACKSVPDLVKGQVNNLQVESLTDQFEAFQASIKSSPLCDEIPNLVKRVGPLLENEANLRKTQRQLRKKLRVLENEIDEWILTMKKRPSIHRLGRARDAKPVTNLEESLTSLDSSFAQIRNDMQSSREYLDQIQRDFPQVMLALLGAINSWLHVFDESIEALVSNVKLLTTTELILPENVDEWRSQFVEALHEREVHLHPNLQLGTADLNLFTTLLFQTELMQREQAVLLISKEQESIQKLVDLHLPELDVSHFDVVEIRKTKLINGKSKTLTRFIEERQKSTWDELKPKHKAQWDAAEYCHRSSKKPVKPSKKRSNSTKIKELLNEYQAQFEQQIDASAALELHEEHKATMGAQFQSLLEQAPSKVQRHFKEKPFSVLILASAEMEVKEFVSAYKRSWHLYPNFHLSMDALLTSSLKQRELDEIIKLPISAKLCTACLQGELTSDQALILQSIDVHNELFEFVKNHPSVDLSLVFALHAQEGQLWLGALLNNPEMFAEIEHHRHEPFEQAIWDLVIHKKVKLWQYACIVRLDFEDFSAKETLLLADDFWSELNEMAALYDVEDALQELIKIYKPIKDTAKPGAQISLNDVFNLIKPIADVTVNTSMAKSKKTKRRKKGRYQI